MPPPGTTAPFSHPERNEETRHAMDGLFRIGIGRACADLAFGRGAAGNEAPRYDRLPGGGGENRHLLYRETRHRRLSPCRAAEGLERQSDRVCPWRARDGFAPGGIV